MQLIQVNNVREDVLCHHFGHGKANRLELGILGEHFLFLVRRTYCRHGIFQTFQKLNGKGILPIADWKYRFFLDENTDGLVVSVFQDIAATQPFKTK